MKRSERTTLIFFYLSAHIQNMSVPVEITTHYCTPDDVAEVMDLPDHLDPTGMFTFTNESHPTYERVQKMILAAEDEVDRRTRRSWRENRVIDQQLTINSYWHDINGWRSDYYAEGGDFVQLRKDIREWDPKPAEEGGHGDKLEIRLRNGAWRDISDCVGPFIEFDDVKNPRYIVYFDYPYGKLYLRTRYFQQKYNALRITYRYGSEEPVPMGLNRLTSLIVASQVINMSVFNIKVGIGSDIAGIKDQLLANWNDEMGRLYSSFQRIGSVHSTLR